ncbi:hypothetical protein NT6N_03300 [Oceaniferula spumae]|uniref:DUF4190 domain-containing protein n=1 Tax=Oceaniferula spumae TaxID=2979115 RepID=A0AAT9FH40_9BACT
MIFLLAGIAILLWVGSVACWVMTLIKMFKSETTGIAVLGILCGLWAFIWGWKNAEKQNHQQIMKIWTGLMIGAIVINVIVTAMSASMTSS